MRNVIGFALRALADRDDCTAAPLRLFPALVASRRAARAQDRPERARFAPLSATALTLSEGSTDG
jgi:hypothetical protein